jgi:hypothetical protein
VEGQGRELGRDYRGPAQLANVPAKACPDLIRGGNRFADKNMRHSRTLEYVPFEGQVHIGAQI